MDWRISKDLNVRNICTVHYPVILQLFVVTALPLILQKIFFIMQKMHSIFGISITQQPYRIRHIRQKTEGANENTPSTVMEPGFF